LGYSADSSVVKADNKSKNPRLQKPQRSIQMWLWANRQMII